MTKFNSARSLNILKIGLVAILLLSVALLAVSCAHTHNFVLQDEREATCENKGYKYYECECGEHYTEEQPATGHKVQYVVEGDRHYQKCTNDGCVYQTVKTEHSYTIYIAAESKPPKCDEDGVEVRACVCGKKHQTVLSATHKLAYKQTATGHYEQCTECEYKTDEVAHSYSTLVQRTDPTCKSVGSETKSCVCGKHNTVELPIADHDYSKYVTDGSEYHWQVCSVCGIEKADSQASHITTGQVIDSTPADCMHYATWTYHCIECDTDIVYPDEVSGYGKHDNKQFDAKEATETADGNKAYWQCQVCHKYFSSKEGTELTWEQIVIPHTLTVVEDYAQLLEIGDGIAENEYAYGKYQVTFTVFMVDSGTLYWNYDNDDMGEFYITNADVSNIKENWIATVNTRIFKSGGELSFVDAELVNVESSDPSEKDKLSINIKVVFEDNLNQVANVKAVDQKGNEYGNNYYGSGAFFPLALNKNDVIHFEAEAYDSRVLKSVIVNNKSYTLTNGRTEDITVTEDITAEFVFAEQHVLQLTKINKIDTSVWNAPVQVINPYLSYEYDYSGSPNDEGRLYKGSKTRFYVDNAYITRVVIEYHDYELTEVVKNAVNVGNSKDGYLQKVSQSIDAQNKATFVFDKSSGYSYFEFNTDVSQARIVSITIYYETYNTFAQ